MTRSGKKAGPKEIGGPQQPSAITLSSLKQDPILLYRIRLLIYDLRNVASSSYSQNRTLSTTDELYISEPYFTPSQAALVKGAITEDPKAAQETEGNREIEKDGTNVDVSPGIEYTTVERAIKDRLANFFDKRRASGDARPCGPHDLAPIYENVFGVDRYQLQEEGFLSRVRRSGLGDSSDTKETHGKGKKDRKGR